jgi:uncharacterized membrane protein YgcG
MIAVKDRHWWIQVSRTLEGDLPNALTKEIGDRMVAPFRQRAYAVGINQYVNDLIAHLAARRGFKNIQD